MSIWLAHLTLAYFVTVTKNFNNLVIYSLFFSSFIGFTTRNIPDNVLNIGLSSVKKPGWSEILPYFIAGDDFFSS
jgi:hypothetical protein